MMVRCPKCQSPKVFRLRIDSDWGVGMGEYEPVNDRSEYTDKELEMDALDRPDIELFHCLECHEMW